MLQLVPKIRSKKFRRLVLGGNSIKKNREELPIDNRFQICAFVARALRRRENDSARSASTQQGGYKLSGERRLLACRCPQHPQFERRPPAAFRQGALLVARGLDDLGEA